MNNTTTQDQYQIWKFGSDVDTDQIVPGRYAPYMRPGEDVGSAAFVEAHPEFNQHANMGDIIVAGTNFGCGSSREYAPQALRNRGIAGLIVASCARIFYRNAINLGLPVYIEPHLIDRFEDRAAARLNVHQHHMVVDDERIALTPLPHFAMRLVETGGIAAYVQSTGRFPDDIIDQ